MADKKEEKKDDKDKDKKEEEDKDDGDAEEFFMDDPEPGNTLGADVAKLHSFLSKVETPSIQDDYQRKKRWRFNVSRITYSNDSDAKMAVFLGLIVTDERPVAPWLLNVHKKFCGPAVPLQEIRNITRYTSAIRNVAPQQRVYFPATLSFRDWGCDAIKMSYRDILRRSLRVELWEHRAYGSHVLLGSSTMPLSSIVHTPPARELFMQRNVAPVARGRSVNLGMVTFNAVLEEAQLTHQLSFRCWSIMLSNQLGHPSFRHPLAATCSGPCVCAALTCCCDTPGVADVLQQWGYGESVRVGLKADGASVYLNGLPTGKRALTFSAPLNSHAMAAAAATPAHKTTPVAGKGGVVGELAPASVPLNDSVSYSELRMVGDARQCLTMNCSRSTLEERTLDVVVRIRCRRCAAAGYGKARIPLSGVSVASFMPVSCPIVFQQAAGVGLCNLYVTGGVLRGFLQWRIDHAPLMHHFTQPGGSVGTGGSGRPAKKGRRGYLAIRVREVRDLPRIRRTGVDPRVTITWAGTTMTTTSKLGTVRPDFDEILKFPLPRLPGRATSGEGVGGEDLLLPLETCRYALVRVWDDPSYANLAAMEGGLEGPRGIARFVRRTELLAEGLIEIPIERIVLPGDVVDRVSIVGVGPEGRAGGRLGLCGAAVAAVRVSCKGVLGGRKAQPEVDDQVTLNVPGAFMATAPSLKLSYRLGGLTLNDEIACRPPLQAADAISLLPDFAAQAHREMASAAVRSTYRVSAPADDLPALDRVPVGDGGNRTMPMPRALHLRQDRVFAALPDAALSTLVALNKDAGGREIYPDGASATNVADAIWGETHTSLDMHPHTHTLSRWMTSGAVHPDADLSHANWWSLLLRMADVSNDQSAADWWLALTPGALKAKRAAHLATLVGRINAAADASAEDGEGEAGGSGGGGGSKTGSRRGSAAEGTATDTGDGSSTAGDGDGSSAAGGGEQETAEQTKNRIARKRGLRPAEAGGSLPVWNEKSPAALLERHINPLLLAADEEGVRRALPSLLSPLPSEVLLRDLSTDLLDLEGAAAADSGAAADDTHLDGEDGDAAAGGGGRGKGKGKKGKGKAGAKGGAGDDEDEDGDSSKPVYPRPVESLLPEEAVAHLAARAAQLVSCIEFSDSVGEVRRLRGERKLEREDTAGVLLAAEVAEESGAAGTAEGPHLQTPEGRRLFTIPERRPGEGGGSDVGEGDWQRRGGGCGRRSGARLRGRGCGWAGQGVG